MKTREEIQQEYERDSRAIWEDYWKKTRVLITNRNDNLHAAEVRRDAALRDRLRGDVQTTINEWGHASHCELYVSQNDIPSACDCIIGDLKRALEGRE